MQKILIAQFFILISLCLTACSLMPSEKKNAPVVEPNPPTTEAMVTNPQMNQLALNDRPTLQPIQLGTQEANGALIGGSMERSMDKNDKMKMSRALDKAPGRPTDWTNESTGVKFTVIPTKKVVIHDNPYCREYETIATKGSRSQQVTGTACIASDGNWHTIN